VSNAAQIVHGWGESTCDGMEYLISHCDVAFLCECLQEWERIWWCSSSNKMTTVVGAGEGRERERERETDRDIERRERESEKIILMEVVVGAI